MKLRCLIIDDEHLARTLIADYCSKVPGLEVVAQCSTASEAIEQLRNNSIDLIFLDIQMPQLSGLEMLKTLSKRPLVILTTAYPEYALDGYEMDVVDYLLKPIAFERFVKAVNKAWARLPKTGSHTVGLSASDRQEKNHLFIKSGSKKIRVEINDILYIEGLREYVKYVTKDKFVVALESMKNLETQLAEFNFVRVHKSFIVSLSHVDAIAGHSLEVKGKEIPIGKSYREQVLANFPE